MRQAGASAAAITQRWEVRVIGDTKAGMGPPPPVGRTRLEEPLVGGVVEGEDEPLQVQDEECNKPRRADK